MLNLCCGKPLKEALKIFALMDLFFDNIQVAVVFIGLAFPNWLPEGYYNYKVLTLHPTLNGTAPMIHKPQEDPSSPPEGESDFILFLAMIGLMACLGSTMSLFFWLWTGASQMNLSKCKKWLCVKVVFLTFLIIVTIFKLASQNYYAFDGLLEILKIYSAYEIYMVKKFIDTHDGDMPILMKPRT